MPAISITLDLQYLAIAAQAKYQLTTAVDDFKKRLNDDTRRAKRLDIRQCQILNVLHRWEKKDSFRAVYRARIDDGIIAVKVLSGGPEGRSQNTRQVREDTLRSVEWVNALNNPYIVGFIGYWEGRTNIYTYFEFAPFGDLQRVIDHHVLNDRRAKHFMIQLVCALEYIHATNVVEAHVRPAWFSTVVV